ncbi:MAG: hypothetical protein U5L04_08175, partial [Trueperaceae bacterium]|nr:hypothetical protein [Trueperaceae bacterium]
MAPTIFTAGYLIDAELFRRGGGVRDDGAALDRKVLAASPGVELAPADQVVEKLMAREVEGDLGRVALFLGLATRRRRRGLTTVVRYASGERGGPKVSISSSLAQRASNLLRIVTDKLRRLARLRRRAEREVDEVVSGALSG